MSDPLLHRIEKLLSDPVRPTASGYSATFPAMIHAIDATDRLRPVDQARVEALAASMSEIGLQQPIIVRPGLDGSNTLRLVAGAHRLAVAQMLGWTEITAIWSDLNDEQARLVEIDENLIRNELSELDRALFLAERKRIYEGLHPETVQGKAKKPKGLGKVANLATFSRYSKDAAKATGFSERTIQRAVALAEALSPEAIASIRRTKLADNQAQLLALAALEPAHQAIVAEAIAAKVAANVAAGRRIAGLAPPITVDPDDEAVQRFMSLWARASAKARRLIQAHIAAQEGEKPAAKHSARSAK